MKKKFLLCMCVVLTLMFSACGGKKTNNETVDTVGGNDSGNVEETKDIENEEKENVDIVEEIEKNELILQTLYPEENATVKDNDVTITYSKPNNEDRVSVSIIFNDEMIYVDTSYEYNTLNYAIYDNDRLFVIVNTLQDSDCNIMHVYKLEDNKLIHVNEMLGAINGIIEGKRLSLTTRTDILGTYFVEGIYTISDEGEFEGTGSLRVLNVGDTNKLVFAKDYSTSGTQYKAGDQVSVLQIDPIGKMVYILDSAGNVDFITYEEDTEQGWGVLIDGASEDEIFSFIPYAG